VLLPWITLDVSTLRLSSNFCPFLSYSLGCHWLGVRGLLQTKLEWSSHVMYQPRNVLAMSYTSHLMYLKTLDCNVLVYPGCIECSVLVDPGCIQCSVLVDLGCICTPA
jgi:hypothetical protein